MSNEFPPLTGEELYYIDDFWLRSDSDMVAVAVRDGESGRSEEAVFKKGSEESTMPFQLTPEEKKKREAGKPSKDREHKEDDGSETDESKSMEVA